MSSSSPSSGTSLPPAGAGRRRAGWLLGALGCFLLVGIVREGRGDLGSMVGPLVLPLLCLAGAGLLLRPRR